MTSNALLPPDWAALPLEQVAEIAPVQRLHWPLLNDLGIEVAVKREDLLHRQLGGNKFYKLHGHLQAFRQSGAKALLSFGGAYSNHLYALVAAGQALGIATIAVVRGERPPVLSPTLADVIDMGMRLEFVSREDYRRKDDPDWQSGLRQRFPNAYWIPEGAGDVLGAAGCAVWARGALAQAPWSPDAVWVAAGTGGTAAGVLAASPVPVHAVLVLKGSEQALAATQSKILSLAHCLAETHSTYEGQLPSLFLESNYHCGGYARFPDELRRFTTQFEREAGLPLDPVYTAKLFWGMAQKALSGYWRPGTRILVLHTGGLQGRRGHAVF